MKVTLDIDEKFSKVISITAIGNGEYGMNISTYAADLSNGTKLTIDECGIGYQEKGELI